MNLRKDGTIWDKHIEWRSPMRWPVGGPYLLL